MQLLEEGPSNHCLLLKQLKCLMDKRLNHKDMMNVLNKLEKEQLHLELLQGLV
jgi:hypothetical protein